MQQRSSVDPTAWQWSAALQHLSTSRQALQWSPSAQPARGATCKQRHVTAVLLQHAQLALMRISVLPASRTLPRKPAAEALDQHQKEGKPRWSPLACWVIAQHASAPACPG